MRHEVDSMTRQWRLGAMTFLALGAVALAVAAIGLYSVIAHGVAQRTQELGIRAAIGARSGDLVRLVVTEGLLVTSVGVSIGLVLALAVGPLVGPLLYAESPRDPIVYAMVGAVLLVVAAVASLRPALRASQVDPVLPLRSD
jgi:ABC-type antimicrobial peptide transport system permease subunit